MEIVWKFMFYGSLLSLGWLLFRKKSSVKWMSYVAIHFVFAAALLYAMGFAEDFLPVYVPLNLVTMTVVGVLGIPGYIALAGMDWFIV